jgi:hypothetical protein
VVVETVLLKRLCVLAMDLGNRLGTLRFLVHDRDPLFTTAFGRCSRPKDCITTLPGTPRMNAICERIFERDPHPARREGPGVQAGVAY